MRYNQLRKQVSTATAAKRKRLNAAKAGIGIRELEKMVDEAAAYWESPEGQAIRAESDRQYREYVESKSYGQEYFAMTPTQKQMHFWHWQEHRGYITADELAKLAGHDNYITRLMRELPGVDPEVLPIPYPEFPEYSGDDARGDEAFIKPPQGGEHDGEPAERT